MLPRDVRSRTTVHHRASDWTHRCPWWLSIRSVLEMVQSHPNVTWHVKCSMTRWRPASGPSPMATCQHHASRHRVSDNRSDRTQPQRVRSLPRASVRSLDWHMPLLLWVTGHVGTGLGPAFGHCFLVKNTSFTSPTSPPLLKCANHQVYHLMHVC
jgi:hypothetical protein